MSMENDTRLAMMHMQNDARAAHTRMPRRNTRRYRRIAGQALTTFALTLFTRAV